MKYKIFSDFFYENKNLFKKKHRNGGKRYKKTVPCRQVLLLYEEFIKKNVYLSKTMEFYLKEYKYGI